MTRWTTCRFDASTAAPVKTAAKTNGAATDVAQLGADNVLLAVSKAKDQKLSKTKLSVKILTQMETATPEVRQQVRDWAFNDANLAGIIGVNYDGATQIVSLSE